MSPAGARIGRLDPADRDKASPDHGWGRSMNNPKWILMAALALNGGWACSEGGGGTEDTGPVDAGAEGEGEGEG